MWRADRRGTWEVQPYVYTALEAVNVSRKLLDKFAGQIFVCVVPMPGEHEFAQGERREVSRELD
jgi:hypothetical protein